MYKNRAYEALTQDITSKNQTMKLLVVLSVLVALAVSQSTTPLDFDWTKLKSIWESPGLQSVSNKADRGGRIVGGQLAAYGQFPHHVLLIIDGNYWCGGSLIKPYWVLTAAHCLAGMSQVDIYSITSLEDGYYWTANAQRIIVHESYVDYYNHDIGLIQMTNPASVTSFSNFIDLPRFDMYNDFNGYTSTIQGFGRYSDASESVSLEKRFVSMPIISNTVCSRTFPIKGAHICTDTTGGKDACNGDSGGGLFVGSSTAVKPRTLVGIVSYGSVVCEQGYPSVYTRVTSYIGWIDKYAV